MLRAAGKVFSFTLLDAAGGEIRACAFNEACERFFPIVQVGAVILLSKASLKPKRDNKVRSALRHAPCHQQCCGLRLLLRIALRHC